MQQASDTTEVREREWTEIYTRRLSRGEFWHIEADEDGTPKLTIGRIDGKRKKPDNQHSTAGIPP